MLAEIVARIVDAAAHRRRLFIVLGILLAAGSAWFAVRHFSINTDIETLIAQDLPWRQRQLAFTTAFPQKGLVAIVEAPTPEGADEAATALAGALSADSAHFRGVVQPDGGPFFAENGLLFQDPAALSASLNGLTAAGPLLGALAGDPSLRGIASAFGFALQGGLDGLRWPLQLADGTLDDVLAGRPALFSWQALTSGAPVAPQRLRRVIEAEPVLDFSALQPGSRATDAVGAAAARLRLAEDYGARVRLTGVAPLNDAQFAVVQTSAVQDTLVATLGVLVILWLALRSWRIIVPVFFSLFVGLAVTAALGLLMVGSFNLFSIAFFVLFVGIGVDFGIQFSVRYRAERYRVDDLFGALRNAALKAGTPLALAAAATAVGFFAFLPTDYRGLSELGLIAGAGMLIAFLASITFVPAMLAALDPAPEPSPIGFRWLAPLDDFLQRHRMVVIALTIVAVAAGIPALLKLEVDFDPINLQNPKSPPVVAYRELQADPQVAAMNAAEVMAPGVEAARTIATRLAALPETSHVVTIETLVPADQAQKRATIGTAAAQLRPVLSPSATRPAPSPEENAAAMRSLVGQLRSAAGTTGGAAPDLARDLAQKLERAAGDPAALARLDAAFVPSLRFDLDRLLRSLAPQTITVDNLPAALKSAWLTADGRARVQALPKGNASAPEVLNPFARAVLAAEPSATGPAISYYEAGQTVLRAFVTAGLVAFAAIAVLLLIALRHVRDVVLTLLPLLLAGIVTLELASLLGMRLNFANIIALPLLLGVGVAFKIYYTIAWRKGGTRLLESPLTRAVVFSASTIAAAFGSMWASDYPGMSSMGALMAVALFSTTLFAVLFQPVLMGPPRHPATDADAEI